MRYIRNLVAIQTRTLLPWPICRSIDLMLIITQLKPNTRTLSRPIQTRQLGGNGVKRNRRRRLQLLPFTRKCQRKHRDRSVIMEFGMSFIHSTQHTPIYSRNKLLNCYHGIYTYRFISWLLHRLGVTSKFRWLQLRLYAAVCKRWQ